MTAPATVPVTVTPEATARVAELGMQRELEQMVQHTLDAVPGLRSIQVVLAPPYDTGDTPRVIIEALRAGRLVLPDKTQWDWAGWEVATFPPEVCEHFVMMTVHEVP